jgi:hypothetical protein
MLVTVVLLASACRSSASWRSVQASDLAQHEGATQRAFVVTRTNAFELDVFESSDVSLRGKVLRAWQLPVTGPGTIYKDEAPSDILERVHWAAMDLPAGSLEIQLGDITHARVPVREKKDPTAPLGWVMVGLAVIWLGLLLLPGIREPEPD